MANYSDVIKGLELFLELEGDQHLSAEHDVVYAGGVDPGDLTDEQRNLLEDAGWAYNETFGSWSHFT